MIKLIIFDIDNTLTDFVRTKDVSIESAIKAMIDAGLMFPPEKIRDEIYRIYDEEGIEYQKVFNRLLVNLIGHVDYKILAAGVVGYRRAREASLVLYPHVKVTLIELLKRGLKLAVISDAPRQEAWLRLCYLQLHHMFDLVLAYEDTGEYKPSPAPFRTVLDKLGIEPEEALMVGDWPERDIAGASELGIRTVFAAYGDTFETKVSGADYDIDDIFSLLNIIDELNGPAEDSKKEGEGVPDRRI
ncbi:MAG: HAD-IA family hydrolase [Candidatus Krumholzibacteria bacterium]|nr:HAD-IA family hydrolase [Candidatus Krumholzibacteria bacterium]